MWCGPGAGSMLTNQSDNLGGGFSLSNNNGNRRPSSTEYRNSTGMNPVITSNVNNNNSSNNNLNDLLNVRKDPELDITNNNNILKLLLKK